MKGVPMSTTQPARTPFYRRWWFIALAVAVVAGGILNALGMGNQDSAAPASTPRPAATTKASAPPKPAGRDAAAIAADVDAKVKTELGVTRYTEACGKVNWACAISEIGPGNVAGNVNVMVQEKLTKDEAERIALNVLNFTVQHVPDVEWVIVHDSTGGVQGQKQRSDSALA